jgi:hypothetical protein
MVLPTGETKEILNGFRHFAFTEHPCSKSTVAQLAPANLVQSIDDL